MFPEKSVEPNCGEPFNMANVQCEGFDLPPWFPKHCECNSACQLEKSWKKRNNDRSDAVDKRLDVHFREIPAVLDSFRSKNPDSVLRWAPKRGHDPIFEGSVLQE